jgi:MFS family permease
MTATPARDRPLRTPDFRRYFAARTVSLLGDRMLPVALTVGVLQGGYGTIGLGYVFAAWSAPIAVFVVAGGVIADRFTARRTMVVADLVRLVAQAVLAIGFAVGTPPLWQILCLEAVAGSATAIFQPGLASVLPEIVRDVQRANACLRIAEALLTMLGPALAGVLVALSGTGTVFAVDAATYAVSAVLLLSLRLPVDPVAGRDHPMWRNLVDGWHEFASRTWLWAVIAIWSVYGLTVFGPVVPLGGSVIVAEHGSTGYGLVNSAYGTGAVFGGLVGLRLRPARPLAAGAFAMLAYAGYPLVVALRLSVPVIAAGFLLAGAGFAFWSVMWSTTVQTRIPGALLNRVSAYDVAVPAVVMPIGQTLAGPVAQVAGARHVLIAATFVAAASSAGMLALPAVRGLRRVPEPTTPLDNVPELIQS